METEQKIQGFGYSKTGEIRLKVGDLDVTIATSDFDTPERVRVVVPNGETPLVVDAPAELFERVALVVKELREKADNRRPISYENGRRVGQKSLCLAHGYQEMHPEVYRCFRCLQEDPKGDEMIENMRKFNADRKREYEAIQAKTAREKAEKERLAQAVPAVQAATVDELPETPTAEA